MVWSAVVAWRAWQLILYGRPNASLMQASAIICRAWQPGRSHISSFLWQCRASLGQHDIHSLKYSVANTKTQATARCVTLIYCRLSLNVSVEHKSCSRNILRADSQRIGIVTFTARQFNKDIEYGEYGRASHAIRRSETGRRCSQHFA